MAIDARDALAAAPASAKMYEIPRFGNVHFLHFTDCHAQLKPMYFREPSVNLGLGPARGQPPHLVGEHLLKHFGIAPATADAHAFTYLDFVEAARVYGKLGGFAHLATLVKRLKAARPGALLLDGGDTWQGSATSLWTNAQDMVDAAKLLGVDVMTATGRLPTARSAFSRSSRRTSRERSISSRRTSRPTDFGDPVFPPYVLREINGVNVAIIGQAFPYTPIANPRYFVAGLELRHPGRQPAEDGRRGARERARRSSSLLSHNGMDVDLKIATRVRGVDAILGGHTHDGVPQPTLVKNAGGTTLVSNAGSNGKFLAVLDFEVKGGKVAGLPLQAAAGVCQPAAGRYAR